MISYELHGYNSITLVILYIMNNTYVCHLHELSFTIILHYVLIRSACPATSSYHIVKDNILKRYVLEGNHTYETTVIPRALTGQILRMAHDELGHNGTHRTYTMLKRLYYWKGLKLSVGKAHQDMLLMSKEK